MLLKIVKYNSLHEEFECFNLETNQSCIVDPFVSHCLPEDKPTNYYNSFVGKVIELSDHTQIYRPLYLPDPDEFKIIGE